MAFRRAICKPSSLFYFAVRQKSSQKPSLSGQGVCLSYRNYQEPGSSGPPVVITHGLMGNKDNWHSLSKLWSKKGRQVITVDVRNHGESPHTQSMDYFLMSEDIINLLDELMIDKACLLGHSMGGKMSMVTALQHPERVDSLIVVDVSPTVSPRAKTYPAFLQTMLKIQVQLYMQQDLPVSTARKIATNMLKEVEPESLVRQFLASNLIQKNNRFVWKVYLDSIINNFSNICGFPEFTNVQYNGPTLFVGGSESKYISESEEPEIKRLFPKSQIQHIEGAGHWVHSDKPSAFLDVVNKFLKENQE